VAGVNGYTSGQNREVVYRGVRHVLPLFPEVEVEAIARGEEADQSSGPASAKSKFVCFSGSNTENVLNDP
jgi:hypothetical protein